MIKQMGQKRYATVNLSIHHSPVQGSTGIPCTALTLKISQLFELNPPKKLKKLFLLKTFKSVIQPAGFRRNTALC